jgi:hypothetical protein
MITTQAMGPARSRPERLSKAGLMARPDLELRGISDVLA